MLHLCTPWTSDGQTERFWSHTDWKENTIAVFVTFRRFHVAILVRVFVYERLFSAKYCQETILYVVIWVVWWVKKQYMKNLVVLLLKNVEIWAFFGWFDAQKLGFQTQIWIHSSKFVSSPTRASLCLFSPPSSALKSKSFLKE